MPSTPQPRQFPDPSTTFSAQVAAALIAALNQQSKGSPTVPATTNNLGLLERWMANEGGLWANNPLNTSLGSAGYPHQFTTSGQDTGIPIFPTMATGIKATASTLQSYPGILHALASGKSSCTNFATAVIHSPWASGHYGYNPVAFCTGQVPPRHVRHHAAHRQR